MPWARHVYTVYTVRTNDRDRLQERLQAEGIQTGVHYPVAAHLQPAFADLGYGVSSFPVSEAASRQVLSLPMYPELSGEEIGEVCRVVTEVLPKVQTLACQS